MRGWWPDEKKESGEWASPIFRPVYNYFKKKEKGFFRDSDISISLTHAGKDYIVNAGLKQENLVDVIPTCVNFDVFPRFDKRTRTEVRQSLNLPDEAIVMVYSGSLGGNYRTDLLLKCFSYLLRNHPGSYFLFITHSSPDLLEKEIKESGIARDRFKQVKAAYTEVARYLMAGDIGMVIYNKGFSVIGRSPTKLGEYWGCGLKAISAKGIGDLGYLLHKYPAGGVLAESIDKDEDLQKAVEETLDYTVSKEELRQFSLDYFDLNKGCASYLKNYRRLLFQ
jgi:glycosyltransferase involved in cell wall biosynthesis